MTGRAVPNKSPRARPALALRTLAAAVCCLAWQALPTPRVTAQQTPVDPKAEQKGQQVINRNTQFLFNAAHTGAKFGSMQLQGATPTATGGFHLKYRMTWVSSLTGNENTTDWTFEFEKGGRFLGFNLKTTWPTGGFELANLGITALREYFLNQESVRNDAVLRQAIQNAPGAAQLTALWLQIDQKTNP